MIADMKPYSAYKDSGVEWLGDVPEHWELLRFKSVMENVVQQTSEALSDDLYIALDNVESWTGRLKNLNNEIIFDSTVKKFLKGDVLFGKLRPYLAKVTQPDTNGVCVGEFFVLRPYKSSINVSFMERLLRSKPIIDAINNTTYGAKMPRANWHFVGGMIVCIPPLSEQTAIVRYLDYMDRRIRRYINAKKKLIALLEEEKQAIIHNAVTRGLDPDVRLKPSGVEWLGDVPEHWELLRFKSVMKNVVEQTSEAYSDDPYIALENVESWTGRLKNLNNEIVFDSTVKRFQKGDVLFGKLRPYLAKVTQPDSNGVCVGEFFVLRPYNAGINVSFMERLLRSKPIIDAINNTTYGAKMPRANWHFVGGMIVCIPPLPEQVAIVYYLDKETDIIDETITRTHRQITLLQEYRTRLIADVVTGKLDVREAAAHLPEESEENKEGDTGELFDELDSMIDDEISPEEMENDCESDEAEA